MSEQGSEAYWAHVMWQNHNVPIEDFLDWPRRKKLAYIASEVLAVKNPARVYPVRLLK